MTKRAGRSTRQATGEAVPKALARRGGSAFSITSEQRRAIVRDVATKPSSPPSGKGVRKA